MSPQQINFHFTVITGIVFDWLSRIYIDEEICNLMYCSVYIYSV